MANPDSDGDQPTISRRTILLGSGFAVANLVLIGALVEDNTKGSTQSAAAERDRGTGRPRTAHDRLHHRSPGPRRLRPKATSSTGSSPVAA